MKGMNRKGSAAISFALSSSHRPGMNSSASGPQRSFRLWIDGTDQTNCQPFLGI